MSKPSNRETGKVFCGVYVSAARLTVAVQQGDQAVIAVARKLLHAIYGIFRSLTPYDGRKLFPALIPG